MLVMDPGRIDKRSRAVRNVRVALIIVLVTGAAVATSRLVTAIWGAQGAPTRRRSSCGPAG